MKISRRWLSDFLPPAQLGDDEQIAALLTARGIEVESHDVVADVSGLIGGTVLSVRPHPGADKLRLCDVDIGESAPVEIVCGAPNVAVGQHVVVAPPGAVLGGNKLSKRDIRGVESNGMLCSDAEIGLGGDSDGIMALEADAFDSTASGVAFNLSPGKSLDDYLQLSDTVFDTAITPNRGDCLSHLGVAREIGGNKTISPDANFTPDSQEQFKVEIDPKAQNACPLYNCIIIRGADAARPSPWWLKTRLLRCGLRSINAAVDITNYIMFACGQPLHAFDLDTLSGGIKVRFAKENESLTLLNGDTVACRTDTLLIADHEKAVAMGGVMGGSDTAVGDNTTNILLEGAFFAPSAVRGKTMEFGLTSDAAYRFERGVNPLMSPTAVQMGAKLIQQICGGTIGTLSFDGAPPPPPPPIDIHGDALRGLIGVPTISTPQAANLLTDAGIPAQICDAQGNIVTDIENNDSAAIIRVLPPSWRFDLEYPADIAEEVIRLWGYDKLPETAPPGGLNIPPMPPLPYAPATVRRRFAAMGFSEIITYAFVSPQWETRLNAGRGTPLPIQNPISQDMSVMRTTLLGGLIDRALFNLNHRQEHLRLFEIGRCFIDGNSDEWRQTQPLFIGGIALGSTTPTQWAMPERGGDFYDCRGWLEEFLQSDADFCTQSPRPAFLHPQQSINIYTAESAFTNTAANAVATPTDKRQYIGAAGVLHPAIADEFGFRRPPLVFELCLEPLAAIRRLPQMQPISRFPLVRRDLSVVAPAEATAGEVFECVKQAAKAPICDIDFFDYYKSDNIAQGKKCYGIRLSMQGTTANLTETDIRRALDAVVNSLMTAGMELRQ